MPGIGLGLSVINRRKTGKNFLSRNSDIVRVGGGRNTLAAGGNLSGDNSYRDFLVYSHVSRIRQNGFVTGVDFYCDLISAEIANMIGASDQIDFKIWRRNISGTYDRIGKENIVSKLSPETVNTITLDTPIPVQEGDFVGFGISRGYTAFNGAGTGKIFYFPSSEGSETGADFEGAASINLDIANITYGQAPLMVGIGDSLMAGHPSHYSFIETNDITDISNQILYQLQQLNSDIVSQNMGIGSQATSSILSRFTGDVVNIKPRYVIILAGVNDISNSVPKATFISNMTGMLNACQSNGIVPIVLKILPWSNGTNVQMQSRDDWMSDLQTLVGTYAGAIWVDCDSSIGEFRAGGDAGNLWDIQAAYDVDGVHLNEAGYSVVAAKTYNTLN